MSRVRLCAWVILICVILTTVFSVAAFAIDAKGHADPGGDTTGSANDVIGATNNAPSANDLKEAQKSEPFAAKLADVVGQNKVAINFSWTLVAGFLVMFMQAGFALVETGFTRAKNAAHTMLMNIGIYGIGVTGFFIAGYALQYGDAGPATANLGGSPALAGTHEFMLGKFGLFAKGGFFLTGHWYDVGVIALFLFQMVFMDTAATIPTGALAERWKIKSFVVYGFFMSIILYPLFANWGWGGGWLQTLGTNFHLGNGYVDFAGSGVVHAVGGLCALAGAIALGPRIGKFNRDGSANAIPGHHIPMAVLGTLILAFGWFGFNPGSMLGMSGGTMGLHGGGNLRVAIVATNTMLASASGMMVAMIYMVFSTGKPDVSMVCNGMLAGLVAITAPCAFVSPVGAFVIGAVSGVLVCAGVTFIEKLHVDDPVGAVAVHGINGLWGVISVGLFADGAFGMGWNGVANVIPKGLFYGGGFGQLEAQLIGCVTLLVWALGGSYLYFKLMDKIVPMRVTKEEELAGIDLSETGLVAYPEFELR